MWGVRWFIAAAAVTLPVVLAPAALASGPTQLQVQTTRYGSDSQCVAVAYGWLTEARGQWQLHFGGAADCDSNDPRAVSISASAYPSGAPSTSLGTSPTVTTPYVPAMLSAVWNVSAGQQYQTNMLYWMKFPPGYFRPAGSFGLTFTVPAV